MKIGLPRKLIFRYYIFSIECDFPKTLSITENQFSGKTYFVQLHPDYYSQYFTAPPGVSPGRKFSRTFSRAETRLRDWAVRFSEILTNQACTNSPNMKAQSFCFLYAMKYILLTVYILPVMLIEEINKESNWQLLGIYQLELLLGRCEIVLKV